MDELDELRIEIARARGWKDTIVSNYPWQFITPFGDGTQVKNCPDWPRDIAAAMELATEARFHIGPRGVGPTGKTEWYVKDRRDINEPGSIYDYGEDLPVVICRAYLAWKKAQLS